MEVKNKIIVFVIIIYLLHHVSIFSDSFFSVSRCEVAGAKRLEEQKTFAQCIKKALLD